MSQITTHVLDTAEGSPAEGIEVLLLDAAGTLLAHGKTNSDGRIGDLGPDALEPGAYQLRFLTGPYLEGKASSVFYPHVDITFQLAAGQHYHVPLLLSPFGYSTYRGS